ncbi:MAG TPA: hypothetical protein VH353_05945 [Caulobacteraceae bacterium]|nr:hypothetical protein [Caulobacteraceae bacterium]
MRVRHLGGGLLSEAGPLTLNQGRALADLLRERLIEVEVALAAAEAWRRAAGWRDPEQADQHGSVCA